MRKSILLLLMMPFAANANLIVNGGFEDPGLSGGSWNVYGSIPGWTTTSGPGIEVQNNVAGSPYEGSQHVELDSHSNSAMAQDVATTVNAVYDLVFAFSPRPGVPANSNGIDVYWGGAFLANVTASGAGLSDTDWTVYSYTVSASSNLTTLGFAATGTNESLGGYLDGVSLTARAVSEPGTLALLGLGLLGLGAARRRKTA